MSDDEGCANCVVLEEEAARLERELERCEDALEEEKGLKERLRALERAMTRVAALVNDIDAAKNGDRLNVSLDLRDDLRALGHNVSLVGAGAFALQRLG